MEVLEEKISIEREKLIQGNPFLFLAKPCRVNDGIKTIEEADKKVFIKQFKSEQKNHSITFFIPASGSGSRMFGALYEFLEHKENAKSESIEFIEQFLSHITEFAFYQKLPKPFKNDIERGQIDIEELIRYILTDEGLNYGHLPKGLIPFHTYGRFIITPFQEHILQGAKLAGEQAQFHFTINAKQKQAINDSIQILNHLSGIEFSYHYSEQNPDSHSYVFDSNNEVVKTENGNYLRRPAGHGALIDNLNQIESDYIFINNIDNIQHENKANTSIETKQMLAGALMDFQNSAFDILKSIEAGDDTWMQAVLDLDAKYKLKLTEAQLKDTEFLKLHFNRPMRICGMVKNEGQAGGGPFWVRDVDGNDSPQIVEKAQINNKQLSVLLHATHFNPVIMVCGVKNYLGNKFDLKKYINNDLYFIVHKTHEGKDVKYIEQPGLWNGSMYHWLTLFFEIDSDCFSPVKTVLDLLKPLHLEK